MSKKFTLSFSLIVVFIVYSFLFRSESVYISLAPISGGQNSKSIGGSSSKNQAGSSVPSANNLSVASRRFDDEGEGEDGRLPVLPRVTQPATVPEAPATIGPVSGDQPAIVPPAPKPAGLYKNGQYTGSVADAYYGNVQVKAIISGGKIADVQFLDYPQDRGTSLKINSQAMPYLTSEAIQAQSASVDTISGATETSRAFRESLGSALAQAKN